MRLYRNPLFILVLMVTGLWGCTATTPPPSPLPTLTVTNTAAPIPPTSSATAIPSSLPTSTLTATSVPSATSTAAPTPSILITPIVREEIISPPPTPDAPLAEALQNITHNALLITRYDRFLALVDTATNEEIWLTEPVCSRMNTGLEQRGFWSFDGAFLAIECESERDTESPVTRILNMETGEIQRFGPEPASPAAWSPTENRLVIGTAQLSDNDPTPVSYIVEPSIQVSVTTPYTGSMAWSPDGSQLAIAFQNDKTLDIHLLDALGTEIRSVRMEDLSAYYQLAKWHPNRNALVFNVSSQSGNAAPLLFNLDTDTWEPIGNKDYNIYRNSWSPTKDWYIGGFGYREDEGVPFSEKLQWSLFQSDGTLVRDLSAESTRQDFTFDWFPDGQRFVMVSIQDGSWIITENSVDSSIPPHEITRVNIPEHKGTAATIKISPDGSLIAFSTRGSSITVVFDLQGKEILQHPGLVLGWRPE